VKLIVARLREFLVEQSPAAAERAAALLDNAITSLTALPERGRPSPILGMHELIVPFGRSAYIVRYAHLAERDEIVVIRIWHGREARE
jgi:plasmid stabilization system protein ParE